MVNYVREAEKLIGKVDYGLTPKQIEGRNFSRSLYIVEDVTWTDLAGISAPDQTYWSVEYIPELNTARFGTYGRGIWDFIIDDSVNIAGDINFDETVNIQDVILLINFVLGIDEPNDSQLSAGDINEDNILNIQDIIATINIILDR